MRFLGLIGLVLALVIVGLLAKKQLSAVRTVTPAVSASAPGDGVSAAKTAREQSQQIQRQYQQALDAALQQQQRKLPDDAQ
ncbi:MAG: hypothetical protein Q4A11_06660 [Brachymonas sp.]|nr:hypothetical protein [Brachymonas sp.]